MKFISKYKELRIVVEPTYNKIVGMNRVLVPGKAIEFANYEYETQDENEIKFLRENHNFRKGIISEEVAQEDREEAILKMAEDIRSKREEKTEQTKKCDECDFEAKSTAGLSTHKRKAHA